MLPLRALAIGLLPLLLAACGGAQDIYGEKGSGRLTGRPLLSKEELHGNCAGLTVTIKVHIDQLKDLQKKVRQEEAGPPPNLMAMWDQRPAVGDFTMERERVREINAALDTKGCKTLDVDEELRTGSAPAAPYKGK